MPLPNSGRNLIATMVVGGAYTAFNAANAFLGVGDSSTAFVASQTDLQAASNKLRKAMDATYPTQSTNILTFQATYGSSEANFAWNEWGVFNASSSGTMLNRKVESLGTKSTGSWTLTVSLTVNNP
jgi:hypothetical protein